MKRILALGEYSAYKVSSNGTRAYFLSRTEESAQEDAYCRGFGVEKIERIAVSECPGTRIFERLKRDLPFCKGRGRDAYFVGALESD